MSDVRTMHEQNLTRLTKIETVVEMHLQQCERRAAMAQRLAWAALTVNVAVLGVLLKTVLHL